MCEKQRHYILQKGVLNHNHYKFNSHLLTPILQLMNLIPSEVENELLVKLSEYKSYE